MLGFIHKARLDHILLGLLIASPFVVFGYPFLGWLFQSAYFLGREVRDNEIHYQVLLPDNWWHGYVKWSHDSTLDVLLPVLVNGFLLVVIYG